MRHLRLPVGLVPNWDPGLPSSVALYKSLSLLEAPSFSLINGNADLPAGLWDIKPGCTS